MDQNTPLCMRLRCRAPSSDPGERVWFHATVTNAQGFKAYRAQTQFGGTSTWDVKRILERLSRGLRVSEVASVWTIWSEKTQTWERLRCIQQLVQGGTRLRLYRVRDKATPQTAAAFYLFFSANPWFYADLLV